MSKRLSVAEYHEDAKRVLPKLVYDYYRSGARDEISLRWNEECFQRIKLLPRFLTNVSEVTTKVTIFGQLFETPIFIAPTAMQKMGHAGMLYN
jgi:isopentenyl diphosphate isomerase/L-lactate dehydrogenase-like FMN-dependent dehydrogenase